MKIIGKTDVGFIVSMSADEVAQLRGINSDYSARYDKKGTEVGSEYAISHLWKEAQKTLGFYRTIQSRVTDTINAASELMKQITGEPVKEEENA